MNNKQQVRNQYLVSVTAAVLSITSQGATAQDALSSQAEGKPESSVETIIVTAQKREQSVKDVPMSIVVLSNEDLVRRGISNTIDIALSVPGVAVQDRGGFSSRYIFMRGVGNTRGSQAMVGVYLDEQDVTSFPFRALDLRAYDLERLEVLRGPQGTLYGSGAMGGAIRYITRKVDLSEVSSDAYVIASATEKGDPSQTIGGNLNLPIINDTLGLRVSGFYESSGGWIDQPALSKPNINDQELYSFRAKGSWMPVKSFEVSAIAMVHRNDTGASNVGEDDDGNYTQFFLRGTTPSGSDDYETYNVTANYTADKFQIVGSTGYFNLDSSLRESGYILPLSPLPATPFDVLIPSFDVSVKSFTQELRISSIESEGFIWTVGASYRDAKRAESAPFYYGLPSAPSGLLPFEVDETTESWAVFGQLSMDLSERLTLGAGLRYYEDRQKNKLTSQSGVFDQVSPRFFGKFSVSETTSLYANIAKGFRSGGFNTAVAIADGASPDFESDSIWSYELGSKGTLLGGKLNFDVAAFYSDYKDAQDSGFVLINNNLVSVVGNLGEAVIKGVNWDIALQIADDFTVGTSGEYLDGEYTKINALSASQAVGDPLKQIPKYHASGWAMYEWHHWLASDTAYVRVDYNRQGEAEFRNRTFGPHYFSISDELDMVNASVGWEKGNWSISIFARNLLNDRGYIDGESLERLAARPRPRTYGVNIRLAIR